jgi:hypothetical protein
MYCGRPFDLPSGEYVIKTSELNDSTIPDEDCYSTRFFYAPHIDYPITCRLTASAAKPAKYPPINYGEYRVCRLNSNYRAKLVEA